MWIISSCCSIVLENVGLGYWGGLDDGSFNDG